MGFHLPGQLVELKSPASDLGYRQIESVSVLHALAVIVSKGLLIEIPEQVERFDADVGAVDPALEQAAEVFEAVRMDLSVYVSDSVADNLMGELALQAIIESSESV